MLPCDKDLHNLSVGEDGEFIVCTHTSRGQKSERSWIPAMYLLSVFIVKAMQAAMHQ